MRGGLSGIVQRAVRRRHQERNERGVIMILMSILMIVLLTFAAIIVDLSDAYAARRQMQNAADAAALAGTRAVDAAKFSGGDPSKVDDAVYDLAVRNGADPDSISCVVVRSDGAIIGPCGESWAVMNAETVGVRVGVAERRESIFAPVQGIQSLTVRTGASAATHPLASMNAPFMVCGNPAKGGQKPGLLIPDSANYPGWQINPAAIGRTYEVHGPQVSDCDAGSDSFKGRTGEDVVIPGWIPDSPGDRAGPTRSIVAGTDGCSGTQRDNCIMILPICSQGKNQGRNVEMFCVRAGAFWIDEISANKHTGRFLGGVLATGGQAGPGVPTAVEARIVKLTE